MVIPHFWWRAALGSLPKNISSSTWKTNIWKPENHPFEKENHLNQNLHFVGSILIFRSPEGNSLISHLDFKLKRDASSTPSQNRRFLTSTEPVKNLTFFQANPVTFQISLRGQQCRLAVLEVTSTIQRGKLAQVCQCISGRSDKTRVQTDWALTIIDYCHRQCSFIHHLFTTCSLQRPKSWRWLDSIYLPGN